MHESKTLEFKKDMSNTFLKTISAYANSEGGTVIFGINDDGSIAGLENPAQVALAIENKINDSISPQPEYTLLINEAESTIKLTVSPGYAKPYLYKGKAYKRNGTSTIEVDSVEFTRLVLEGKNISFEQLPAKEQELSFEILGDELVEKVGISSFNSDTLKTLNLLSKDGEYNNAAAILADQNGFPGIDMACFGESLNIILRRVNSVGKSALLELRDALQVFRDLYCFEQVDGLARQTVQRIPESAFREAVANAIVHRTWDVNSSIRISMYEDRLEISSPGGLPTGISESEYLSGSISVMRNPILANVFFRLNIVEAFGTGIRKIRQAYESSAAKPKFHIEENSITVILPVMKMDLGLTDDQMTVLELLSTVRPMATGELSKKVSFSKSKLGGILKELISINLVSQEGNGRGTKYKRNDFL